MITDSISEVVGINPRTFNVYLDLVNNGTTSVHKLALRLGINRTTLYKYLSTLEELKLIVITTSKGKNHRKIIPLPPQNIQSLIKDQKAQLNSFNKFVDQLTQKVQKFNTDEITQLDPKLEIITNYNRLQEEYVKVLWSKEVKTIASAKVFKYFPKNPEIFSYGIKSNSRIKIREILEDSKLTTEYISKVQTPNYLYKKIFYTPFATDFLIYDKKVFVVSGNSKTNLIGLLTKNSVIVSMADTLFETLWDNLQTT